MAKLTPRAVGRPALLGSVAPLRIVWLIALARTKAGADKPPIRVRLAPDSPVADCHRGWPAKGKSKFRVNGYLWPLNEWRLATEKETRELDAPPKSEEKAEKEKKRDTIPSPPPPPRKSEAIPPPPLEKLNGTTHAAP